MQELEIVLALLVSIVLLAALADRVRLAYPIAMIAGGMLFGWAPFIPLLQLDPELVLLVLLAPSLFAAAVSLDWPATRTQQRPILELAIRLVLTSTAGVAIVAVLVIDGMGWGPAIVLGAIVSPPDAVATISVVRRLNLPHNLVAILEGESLVNDATALTLYRVAVAAVVSGTFSLFGALGSFVLVAVGGTAIGVAIGWVTYLFLSRLVVNPAISVAVTLVTPVTSYLLAEEIGVSGVLAVVAAGLITARKTLQAVPSTTRVQAISVWQLVSFLTEGFAFVLIGLQVPFVFDGIEGRSAVQLTWYAVAIVGTTVLIRLVWVFVEIGRHLIDPDDDTPFWRSTAPPPSRVTLVRAMARRVFRREPLPADQLPRLQGASVIGWSGLRGIVTLAPALAIPFTTDAGEPFPHRDLIIFLAFCVIVATLVGQGGTLPWLIRRLAFAERPREERQFQVALASVLDSGLARLDEVARTGEVDPEIARHHRSILERRRSLVDQLPGDAPDAAERRQGIDHLAHEVEESERLTIRQLAAAGQISETLRRRLERALDLRQVGRERPD